MNNIGALRFSDRLEAVLRNCGWNPGREFSIESCLPILTAQGFAFTPNALRVLTSLGGLTIEPVLCSGRAYTPGHIRFNPALAFGEFDRVDFWQEQLGIKLSPLGDIAQEEILLLATDGRLFSVWNDVFWLYGESFEPGLESLVFADQRPIEYARMREWGTDDAGFPEVNAPNS